MSDEIINIQKENAALQKKYDKVKMENEHLALDFKKAKLDVHKANLDVKEARLKYEKRVFQLMKKLASNESELDELNHKSSFSHLDNEKIYQEIEKMKTDLKSLNIEELSSDPL